MLKHTLLITSLLAASGLAHTAEHVHHKTWTAYPLLMQVPPFSRTKAALKPLNIEAETLQVYPSTAKPDVEADWRIEVTDGIGRFRTKSGDQGAYHMVVAQQATAGETRIATALVQFSNPAPPPRAMLARTKAELEIVPLKLPREHAHYRSGQTWSFEVRHKGHAMPGVQVKFESANGTQQTLKTDKNGRVRLTFPADFPQQAADDRHAQHRRGPKASFVLATQLKTAEHDIVSAFNYHYRPSAWVHKNLWLGSGFALLGMLAASPLLRRRHTEKGKHA